ncbi:outer membrane beta-barrel family protein [uncultured Acetobacteroides sp.]|uniref:outer membrane beta-barrel family protein n=1 Tax=uncultured Acetobacteroides sp. TaxID=1760811 RepID=UPI0029F493DA|nr:outer membrane beta-barrel family protein [uncultured Acetobacteroides sp.]
MRLKQLSRIILLVGPLALDSAHAASNKGTITGKIIDKMSRQPIPYVAVSLGQLPDTIIKKSAQTDEQGNYSFSQVDDGRYVITAYMVGYGRKHSKPVGCRQNTVIAEELVLENTIIKEVVVKGKRPAIEQKADRTVLNVENSASASAENAYEVLSKAPGVTIDKEESISIKGREGVMVTINDKPTYLSGSDLISYLKMIHATEIDKVEIISTPPARYEAAGNTGIINIKLKKNNKVGINGAIGTTISITNKLTAGTGFSLNMRRGKVNTFGSFNFGNRDGRNSSYTDRILATDTARIALNSKANSTGEECGYRTGVDYELSNRHTLGILVLGSKNNDRNLVRTHNDLFLKNGDIAKYLNTNNNETTHQRSNMLNANYRMSIDTNGRALNVDVDYVEYKKDAGQDSKTAYFKPSGENFGPDQHLKNQTPSRIYIKSFRIDYTHPFSKTMLLEAGIKGSSVSSDNNMRYDKYSNSSNSWEVDNGRSNHFKYYEDILAAYTSLAYERNGWSLKGGLRAEETWSKGNSVSIRQTTRRSYLNLFPTLFVQRSINTSNSLGISYNRRIDRPSYHKLNPFEFRVDEYTYQEGNPYLNPQYTDNIEVNHAWKNMVFTSLRYSHTKDVQVDVPEEMAVKESVDNNSQTIKAIKAVARNLHSLSCFMLSVSANLNPTPWFVTYNNFTALNNEYRRGDQESRNSKLTYAFASYNSFILPHQFIFQISLRYNSAVAYGLADIDAKHWIDLSLKKDFLKNKLTARFSIDDVLYSQIDKAYIKYDGMNLYNKAIGNTQIIRLSLTYRFVGNDGKQERQRSTSSEEEMSRTGK